MTGLSARNFERIARYIEQRAGIRLPKGKSVMVEGRVAKRVRALGLDSANEYADRFFSGALSPDEDVHLIDSVTTNKTDFFREPDHFAFFRDTAIPQLLAVRGGRGPHMMKFWSAASSIGAEAYTMAMVAADLAAERRDFQFAVLGTDISSEVLRQARRGVYPADLVEPVPPAMRKRYLLMARDPKRPEVRIVPELRRLVRFERLNLIEPVQHIDRDVDVIFCRNVLIYFDKPTQARVVSMLAGHLRPGGFLVLGHSEAMSGEPMTELRQVRPTVFQNNATKIRKVA
jgi:chemotaxis protein methyltransferase CheR